VEIRLGQLKKYKGKFQIVTEFKYLGVYIYDTRRIKSSRKRLLKQTEDYLIKSEKTKHVNVGIGKIAWIWWTSCKILYAALSDVTLNWLEPEKVDKINLKLMV